MVLICVKLCVTTVFPIVTNIIKILIILSRILFRFEREQEIIAKREIISNDSKFFQTSVRIVLFSVKRVSIYVIE